MDLLTFLCIMNILSSLVAMNLSETVANECYSNVDECEELKHRWVCGSDNQTYLSMCHLIKAQCKNHQLKLKYRGPCKECMESRLYAMAYKTSSTIIKFVPRCRADGSFAPVQCMKGAGCWCSDIQGKPIPNTTTTIGKPKNCKRHTKLSIRRSPARKQDVRRDRTICRKADQRIFNNNLIHVFHGEYRRNIEDTLIKDENVVDWKFMTLDRNIDNVLDSSEYSEFRRLVRKIVRPKKCARTFAKNLYCDENGDKRLSPHEWRNCFLRENTHSAQGGNNSNRERSDTPDSNSRDGNDMIPNLFYESPAVITPYPPVYLLRPNTVVEKDLIQESEIDSGCASDRAAALEEQKSHLSSGQLGYIPECTSDGRYQRVQCYRSVGYCWCVHEDTGKNIAGTSVKGARPNCTVSRPIKGCTPNDKDFFIKFKEYFRDQIADKIQSGLHLSNWKSDDERIATLSFVFIDNNKNKILEKSEWHYFRELISPARSLHKCGRKMPRYCDANNDKIITLSEWLNCLLIDDSTSLENVTDRTDRPSPNAAKFKGPNPLDSFLKSD